MKAPTDILGRNTSGTSFLFEKEDVLDTVLSVKDANKWINKPFRLVFGKIFGKNCLL